LSESFSLPASGALKTFTVLAASLADRPSVNRLSGSARAALIWW
jgi:hypothetical protein